MGMQGRPVNNYRPAETKPGGEGCGGVQTVRRIKFPWLICRSSCREVKVKANPAVRGARIKVFEIWIQGLSGFQYQGLSIISVDRRSIPLAFLFFYLQGDFWQCFHGVLSMKALPLMTRWELSFRLWGFSRSSCSQAAGESGEVVSLRILYRTFCQDIRIILITHVLQCTVHKLYTGDLQ